MIEIYIILLFFMIFFMYFLYIKNKKIGKRLLLTVMFIIILLFVGIIVHVIPKETNDLYRHYLYLDSIRQYGFWDIKSEDYDSAIGSEFIFYLISLTGVKELLPIVSFLWCYLICFYIIYDYQKKNKIQTKSIIMAIFFSFSFVSLESVISGVRTAMAMSMMALGAYNYLIKKKLGIKEILIFIFASLIHPVALVPILILLLKKFITNKILIIVGLSWGLMVNFIILLLKNISLNILAGKLEMYFYGSWIDDIRLFWAMIVLAVIFIIMIWYLKKNIKVEDEDYIDYLLVYFSFTLGSALVAKIFLKRLFMFIAFGSLPLINNFNKIQNKNVRFMINLFLLFICMVLMCYGYREIVGNMEFIE